MRVSSDGSEADAAWAAEATGSPPAPLPTVDRRTPLGNMLRRACLDELPQLINILRGEMSFIGPRPERPGYVRAFERHVYRYGDRHRVKSGLTGWAQVQGLRGECSLEDRVEWDNYYVENWSPGLDLKILLLTIPSVVVGGGSRDRLEVQMERASADRSEYALRLRERWSRGLVDLRRLRAGRIRRLATAHRFAARVSTDIGIDVEAGPVGALASTRISRDIARARSQILEPMDSGGLDDPLTPRASHPGPTGDVDDVKRSSPAGA
jgi:hypothetical protein